MAEVRSGSSAMKSAAGLLFCAALLFTSAFLFSGGIVGNYGDIALYAAPFRHFAKTSFQEGVLPLWNPYIFCGTPFLASPQSSLFYPGTLLFHFLPLKSAFNLFAFLHFFLNALGMFLFLRSWGRSRNAALAGALVWTFSFFFMGKLGAGHVIHLSGYAWIPYVLTFALKTLDENGGRGGFFFFLLTWALSLQFFSGHIQVFFHTLILLLFLFGWRSVFRGGGNPLQRPGPFLAGGLALAGLCLVQALPTLTFILQSSRFRPTDLTGAASAFQFATSYSMEWKALLGMLLPFPFGSPMKNSFFDPEHPSLYFETYTLYMGLIPFVLAAAGLAVCLKRKKYLLPLLVLASLVLALGQNTPLYQGVWKLLGFLRVPARFYVLVLWGLTLALAYFWDQFLRPRSARIKTAILLLILADLYVCTRPLVWTEPYRQGRDNAPTLAWIQDDIRTSGASGQSRLFSSAEIGNANKTMFFRLYNVNGYEAVLQKSLLKYFAAAQGVMSVTTTGLDWNDPFQKAISLTGAYYLANAGPPPESVTDQRAAYQNGPVRVYRNETSLSGARVLFSIRRFPSDEPLLAYLNRGPFDPRKEILASASGAEVPAEGETRAFPAGDVSVAHLSRPDPNRIHMILSSPPQASFWLFNPEAFYPGWEVWAGQGQKSAPFRADGYFQGWQAPEGSPSGQVVRWVFNPLDFRVGALASLASLIALFICGLRFARSRLCVPPGDFDRIGPFR